MALGAGTDRIFEEVSLNFPKTRIFEINKEIVGTTRKAESIALNFYESRGAVLIGTDMALPYLYKKIRLVAASSIDSLFSIPDFRIKERIFGTILELRNLSKEKFLVQTRNPDDPIFELCLSGNIIEFYKSELEERQVLNYPPYGLFIKITVRGTKVFASRESENIKKIFEEWEPLTFPSIQEKRGEQYAINTVIKIERGSWPDISLVSKIRNLPPQFEVKIDPDSVL
jgi:primosomal protein N' (replication factor Y)